MTPGADLVFPLIPSRRGRALDVAGSPSRRRGSGNEIASSRPYRRGDAIRLVDWAASARLSTARGTDEFVVRDHFAEDAVRIVVVADRSPSMALFPDWLPWLDKPAAVREAVRMIIASGAATNALIGSAEVGGPAPRSFRCGVIGRSGGRSSSASRAARADGPPDSLDRALELLSRTAPHRPRRNVRLRPLRLPPAAEPGSVDRRARGRLGRRSRRRPGSRLGALVPGRLGRHASAREPRRRCAVTRPAQPQGDACATRAQRAARRPAGRRAPRARARPGHDHEQRQERRARRVPRAGRKAGGIDREAIGEQGRLPGTSRRTRRRAGCSAAGHRADPGRCGRSGARHRPRRPPGARPPDRSTTRSPSSGRSRPPPRCSAIPSRPRSTSTRTTPGSRLVPFASRRASSRIGSRRPASIAGIRATSRCCAPGSHSNA